jgi:hypothetical protein
MMYAASDPNVQAEIAWQPFSHLVGLALAGLGGVAAAQFGSNLGWWLHNCVVLVFLNFLPLAKHFHIITSLPNVFFIKTQPTGALSKMDLENGTTFGTSRIDRELERRQGRFDPSETDPGFARVVEALLGMTGDDRRAVVAALANGVAGIEAQAAPLLLGAVVASTDAAGSLCANLKSARDPCGSGSALSAKSGLGPGPLAREKSYPQ